MKRRTLVLVMLLLAGCAREEQNQRMIQAEDPLEAQFTLVFDGSADFRQRILEDKGECYQFVMQTIHDCFQARAGSNDRIMIATVTDQKERFALYAASPEQFQRDFPDGTAFRNYLASNMSVGAKTKLYRGIAEALEYTISLHERPGWESMQSATLIFSNMLDEDPEGPQQKERLLKAFRSYSRYGGLGIYWIHPSQRGVWEKHMRENGYPGSVETQFVKYPQRIRFN